MNALFKSVKLLCVMLILLLVFVPAGLSAYAFKYADNGKPMRWYESCAYYTLHQDGAPGIDFLKVQETIRQAFDHWEDVPCSYFFFEETVPASCTELGLNDNVGNMNLLFFVEENWVIDNEHSWDTIALTTVSWNKNTGRIHDADIEFNSEFFHFEVDGVHISSGMMNTEKKYADLENTATHEIGHFLGLQHSSDFNATMYEETTQEKETSKRSLEQDDMDGLCELYPIDQDPGICLLPFCGLDVNCTSTECGSREEETMTKTNDKGCSMVSIGASAGGWWRFLLNLGGLGSQIP